jgi:hypothetical protein
MLAGRHLASVGSHRYFQWRLIGTILVASPDLFIHRITRILKAALDFPEYVVGTGGKWNQRRIESAPNMLLDYRRNGHAGFFNGQ